MKLEEKALLAKLQISAWEGRKKDRIVEDKVDEMFEAKNSGSFRKILLDSEELRKIINIAFRARVIHAKLTLPWNGDGTGILSIDVHEEYTKQIRECKDKFYEAVQEFLAVYEDQKERDKKRLGQLYNPNDYPTRQVLESKFRFQVIFLPVPSSGDFRIKLQSDEIDRIKSEFEQHFKNVFTHATRDLYRRLYEAIKHLHDRLSDESAILRSTLISNIAELVALLPKLNITNDPTLNQMTETAAQLFTSIDIQDLRDNQDLRRETADVAKNMINDLEAIL